MILSLWTLTEHKLKANCQTNGLKFCLKIPLVEMRSLHEEKLFSLMHSAKNYLV